MYLHYPRLPDHFLKEAFLSGHICLNDLLLDIKVSQLELDPPKDLDQFTDLYDSTLRVLVNKHAALGVMRSRNQRIVFGVVKKSITVKLDCCV